MVFGLNSVAKAGLDMFPFIGRRDRSSPSRDPWSFYTRKRYEISLLSDAHQVKTGGTSICEFRRITTDTQEACEAKRSETECSQIDLTSVLPMTTHD